MHLSLHLSPLHPTLHFKTGKDGERVCGYQPLVPCPGFSEDPQWGGPWSDGLCHLDLKKDTWPLGWEPGSSHRPCGLVAQFSGGLPQSSQPPPSSCGSLRSMYDGGSASAQMASTPHVGALPGCGSSGSPHLACSGLPLGLRRWPWASPITASPTKARAQESL